MSSVAPAVRFDVERIRADFPILGSKVHGRPLVYLDSAASAQKPHSVVETVARFYETDYSNVHRGVHDLSQRATARFEAARETVRSFLGAAEGSEVVFTKGTTEAVNLVAQSFGRSSLGPGDEVLLSEMEHHSNIVPWQLVCAATGATLRVLPVTDAGELLVEDVDRLVGERTKIVSIAHVSNALGTVNPVREVIEIAHRKNALVLLDGAQAAPHLRLDVRDLGCDFYAFSGHKLFGPSGIGVLYGRSDVLASMPPWEGGGEMIRSVSFEETTYADPPHRFEAGTPNIAGAVGLGAAIDYLEGIDRVEAAAHEAELVEVATARLSEIPGLRIVGTAREKVGIVSFVIEGIHPHDIGTILDRCGIAVRAGHHCTQPLMRRLGLPATVRASFSFYNRLDEVDALVGGIHEVLEVFG